MRLTLTTIIAALACALSGTAGSAQTPSREDAVRLEGLVPFLHIYHQFLLLPVRKDCKNPPVVWGLPTCVIDVDVWLVKSGGIEYCLTRFPKEVTFDRLTRVVWKLSDQSLPSSTAGKTYNFEFHSNHGILPFVDRFTQVIGGGVGDGGTGNNKWWYHRLNLHTQLDPTIVYLPMILQVNAADSNDVGVCAVGDPRMVNE